MGIFVELWCSWGLGLDRAMPNSGNRAESNIAPGEISFCLHCALPCPDYRRLAITTNELPVCVLLADNNCELDW